MSRVRLVLAILACLARPYAVAAQPATGAVTGTISGDAGNRLSGVTVTVQNQVTGIRSTATTDADGRYEIANLPVEGEYQVSVALAGFTTAASENVRVVPNAILVVNFRLKLTVTESLAVSAPTPPFDTVRSTVQQTINEQLAHSLPLVGRNFIPLAALAAGFTGNPNFPSPQGQIYWTNNIVVDGASHFSKWRSTARTFYSGYGLESIKEVQVFTNRYSAEYGESLASVTSAVTKAGTNEFHGSGLLFLQDSALNARPPFALVNPPAASERYGFTLGGPFAKDRTHFLESYEGRRSRNHNVVVSPDPEAAGGLVPDNEDEHLVFFRVDHRPSEKHLMMGRYNGQFFRWHDQPGGLSLPGTGTEYRNDVHTVLATDRLQFSERLLNEVRVQFARYVDVRTDLKPTVFVSRAGYSQEGGTLGAFGFGADPEDTWEAADTVSTWLGPHALKLGGGTKYVRAHNAFLNYGRGAYFFAGAPDLYPQPFLFTQGVAPDTDSAHADPRSVSGFGFIQDDWRIRPRLTLNLGARYDIEKVDNVRNYSVPVDKNNVQPRAGLAWEPLAGQRMVVRGGAGLYTQQQLLFYINRVQLEGPDGTLTIALSPDSPLFPKFPNVLPAFPRASALPPRDIQRVDTSFRNPYSLQSTIGVERAFNAVTVSADYVYLNGRDLMSLVDTNAPASNPKPAQRSVAQADATRPLPAVPGSYRNIFTLGNLGRSWYHALQVKADRSTGRLQMIASYTLSRAQDMDNYQLPEDSRNIEAEKARANTDLRQNVMVGFTWQMPGARRLLSGWSLSGIGVFRSSRPYTITWGDDRNGTTQNDARPDGRNTGKTDAYQNVDLALSRRFSRGSTSVEARVEAFNLFNTTNYDEYVGALLSPLFAKPISAFANRRIQLAAIVRF
jgi:outer membrane receptor protein involved in Fe transport